MDKEYTRYIRLKAKRMKWTDHVAVCIGEHNADAHTPKMLAFKCAHFGIRYIPESEAIFITAKEYFEAALRGQQYNG